MPGEATSFVNVKVTATPLGESAVSTQCILSLDGLGSERDANELQCLNDEIILAVGNKKYDTLTFEAPDDETHGSFWDVVQNAYDGNVQTAFVIEFDNAKTPTGSGTLITGAGKFTASKSANNSTVLVTTFSFKWDGSPVRTPADSVVVVSSTIEVGSAADIVVTFDETPSIEVGNITYRVNGAAAQSPASTGIVGSVLTITANADFVAGDNVEWIYNSTTYAVTNNLV